ncbi:hypothetical protein ES707_18291 [subsurface metagenome]
MEYEGIHQSRGDFPGFGLTGLHQLHIEVILKPLSQPLTDFTRPQDHDLVDLTMGLAQHSHNDRNVARLTHHVNDIPGLIDGIGPGNKVFSLVI